MITRRNLLAYAALGTAARAIAQPGAEHFLTRPVTLWVPWAAGGATDLTMRTLAGLAGRHLGVDMHVENRGGAGGTLAMPVLQQAAPDGYTIAQIPYTVFRAPWIRKVLWDPIRDVTPIIQISGVTFGVLVKADSRFNSLREIMDYAKANPGRLTVATNGVGTTPHVVMDELFLREGLRYVHVPYKGTSQQMLALASGEVMVGVNSTGFAPFVDNNTLRLLVTFGEQRPKRWPQVPTLKEQGYGIVATSPYGIGGPRGMPARVVDELHEAFKVAMNDPAHLDELALYDQQLDYLGSEDYGQAMRKAYEHERVTVERMGLQKEQE
jgi:tripartite-type tricarboxylate transporter receptor subunit TctC